VGYLGGRRDTWPKPKKLFRGATESLNGDREEAGSPSRENSHVPKEDPRGANCPKKKKEEECGANKQDPTPQQKKNPQQHERDRTKKGDSGDWVRHTT